MFIAQLSSPSPMPVNTRAGGAPFQHTGGRNKPFANTEDINVVVLPALSTLSAHDHSSNGTLLLSPTTAPHMSHDKLSQTGSTARTCVIKSAESRSCAAFLFSYAVYQNGTFHSIRARGFYLGSSSCHISLVQIILK